MFNLKNFISGKKIILIELQEQIKLFSVFFYATFSYVVHFVTVIFKRFTNDLR